MVAAGSSVSIENRSGARTVFDAAKSAPIDAWAACAQYLPVLIEGNFLRTMTCFGGLSPFVLWGMVEDTREEGFRGKRPGWTWGRDTRILKEAMPKRILLFVATNILVVTAVTILCQLLGLNFYLEREGISYSALMAYCLVWGFVGAFVSLALSRAMAKWMMGVQVLSSDNANEDARWLVETTHELCRKAGIRVMPEVGVYPSDEPNAFATGPTRNRSLVAVSTALLEQMPKGELEGVLAHEVAHIENGDMVTMTLVQGVVNAFVLFLARAIAYAVSTAVNRNLSGIVHFLTVIVLQIFFSLLGSIVVCHFSRQREFRADRGAARLAGREKMKAALLTLETLVMPAASEQNAYATLKISSGSWEGNFLTALFRTHPPISERVARLDSPAEQ